MTDIKKSGLPATGNPDLKESLSGLSQSLLSELDDLAVSHGDIDAAAQSRCVECAVYCGLDHLAACHVIDAQRLCRADVECLARCVIVDALGHCLVKARAAHCGNDGHVAGNCPSSTVLECFVIDCQALELIAVGCSGCDGQLGALGYLAAVLDCRALSRLSCPLPSRL